MFRLWFAGLVFGSGLETRQKDFLTALAELDDESGEILKQSPLLAALDLRIRTPFQQAERSQGDARVVALRFWRISLHCEERNRKAGCTARSMGHGLCRALQIIIRL